MASEHRKLTAFDIWERFGITEHLGGVYATRRLIELCRISPGQLILDIGCGTGYTACILARKSRAHVVAADISPQILALAKARAVKDGVRDRVAVVRADAEKLPFLDSSLHTVIAESVLVFCNQREAASEAYRVLKPCGAFGMNELTYLRSPPERLRRLLADATGVNITVSLEEQWQAILREAGFTVISSTVQRISLRERFVSHLRVDGLRKYVSAIASGILDPAVRATFLNGKMLKEAIHLAPYIGYGLYIGMKPIAEPQE